MLPAAATWAFATLTLFSTLLGGGESPPSLMLLLLLAAGGCWEEQLGVESQCTFFFFFFKLFNLFMKWWEGYRCCHPLPLEVAGSAPG